MPTPLDPAAESRAHRIVAVVAVLVLVIAALAWHATGDAQPVTPATNASAAIAAVAPYALAVADSSAALAPTPGSAIVLQRDPFAASTPANATVHVGRRSGIVASDSKNTWSVSAVLITSSRRAAVIDDSLVDEGAALPGGAHLTSVQPDRVIVTDVRGTRHTISAHDGGESL